MKTLLTVHATMTPPSRLLTKRDLDRRDRDHGFSKIGYHFVIERDGTLAEGRALTEASVHDSIKDAKSAISVCLVGGTADNGGPADNFADEQWDSLIALAHRFESIRIESKTPAVTTDQVARRVVRIRR